jgi:molybdate/tungstate transport system ATP-binding protein
MLDVKVSLSRGNFLLKAEIHDGGFVCLSGLNGSGKSTLLNIIAGKLKLDEGYVKINAKDVSGLPPEGREVVLVNPDSYIPHLQVEKHLLWGARARKVPVDYRAVDSLKAQLGIDYQGRVDTLSLGMRERVSLATALLSRPKVLLVDEAFSNIDNRFEFIEVFKGLCAKEGVDLVHTTQQKSDARIADHHYDMVDGTSTRVF